MTDSRRVPAPNEVFTPGRLPLREQNVYATRKNPEADLNRLLGRYQIPLVTGEYGVGKSSLVRRYFQDREPEAKLVYVASAGNQDVESIYKYTLEQLQYTVKTSETSTRIAEGGVGFRGLTAKYQQESGVTRELVVTTPTDLSILDILADAEVTLVIDEMHRATDKLRGDLATLVKAVRTADRDYPRIVLVGTSFDAERLSEADEGINRYVKDVFVPLLTDDEASFIATEGFRRLNLDTDDDVITAIVATAAGAPTIVHNVCLEMAEMAVAEDRTSLTQDDLNAAIYLYLDEHGKRLYSAYMKVIETTGPKRWRKRVLHAMAHLEGDYATSGDITEKIAAMTGDEATSVNIGEPLLRLKSDDYGPILKDVERYDGSRVHNLTTFSDPMMKAFIRFMVQVDERGVELPAVER